MLNDERLKGVDIGIVTYDTGKLAKGIFSISNGYTPIDALAQEMKSELDLEDYNQYTKIMLVTNHGDILELNNDNEVDDVDLQWFRKNINAQVLPNGYCRLPVIARSFPYANACLDFTHFCTSKQFLPQHPEHLRHTKELLAIAKDKQW
ncbi:transposase B transposon Tn554 [Bacillus cereus VD169]|nr:transposase B transposon Tn554 [Bacillus cereus VD169]